VLANIRPAGTKYLMEDFYYAGGLRALLRELGDRLKLDCMTVNGKTLGENLADAKIYNDDVIRRIDNPLSATGGLAVCAGTSRRTGRSSSRPAAEPHLLKHTGRAVVFSDYNDHERAHRRRSARRRRDLRARAEERRPARRSRHAGMGRQLPIPKKL
jgi:dihydroxy-acid dehydratase